MRVSNLVKKNKFIINSLLNIISTVIPLLVLQIVLLPLISRRIPEHEYGAALTVISLLNILPGVFAISLNNVRLLKNNLVKNNHVFNNVLFRLLIINIFLVLLSTVIFENRFGITTILTVFLSVIWLLREYYLVEFQLILDYNKILLNNLFLTAGYFIGYLLFYATSSWQMVYITGYIFSLFHIYYTTKINFVSATVKDEIIYIQNETFLLSGATLLIRITSYADRLILFPLMGGKVVAIYYAATILAKVISMGINPISGVMLSYLSKMKNFSKKTLNMFIIMTSFICFIGYFVVVIISKYILVYLYPQFYHQAMELIPYTTIATLMYVFISVLNPIILKMFAMRWQMIINGSNAILYILLTLIGLKSYGIIGFCIGIMISNLIKIVQMLLLYSWGNESSKPINKLN